MKSVIICFFILASAHGISLGQPVFKPVPANEVNSYLNKIEATSRTYRTISCRFIQTKTTSMLKDPSISKGSLYIKDSKKLRWECVSPYQYVFILNNGKGTVLKNNHTTEFASKSKRFPREISEFLLGGFTPELVMDKKKFNTTFFLSSKLLKMNLVPVQKRMKSAMSLISICFDLKDYSISSIELTESSGDKTEIVLIEKQFNMPVSDDIFSGKN
jgi:outer membrane lipoprotein carrier protein